MIINHDIICPKSRKIARICFKLKTKLGFYNDKKVFRKIEINNDYRNIPVIINNFNRFEWLKGLLEWLEKAGMRHIFIIDNSSNYEPLIDYYNETKHTVIKLNANIGYKSIWDTGIYKWFNGLPYIYTDPDVIPSEECPLDAIEYLYRLLCKYEHIKKVGFGLKIDDLPNHYHLKQDVIKWESKFWEKEIDKDIFEANIDTTLAIYAPYSKGQQWGKSLRTGGSYVLKHLPWYEDANHPSEEEINYKNSTIGSAWY